MVFLESKTNLYQFQFLQIPIGLGKSFHSKLDLQSHRSQFISQPIRLVQFSDF